MQLPKISAPLVISGLALAVSLGGVGAAATGLINGASIKPGTITGKQIKTHSVPVIKLTGKLPKGPRGATGPAGPFPRYLPAGVTVQGHYDVGGTSTAAGHEFITSISWLWPLRSVLDVHFVPQGGPSTPQCPGTFQAPTAVRGNLCVYARNTSGPVVGPEFQDVEAAGTGIIIGSSGVGVPNSYGTWAVTGN